MSPQHSAESRSSRAPRVLDILVSENITEPWRQFDQVLKSGELCAFGQQLPSLYYTAICSSVDLRTLDIRRVVSWLAECSRALHPFGSMEVILLDTSTAAVRSGISETLVKLLDTAFREIGFAWPEWHLTVDMPNPPPPLPRADVSFAGYAIACYKPEYYHDSPLSDDEFTARCSLFRASNSDGPRMASYVVPASNEAKGLPRFLASLEEVKNTFDTAREFIFVLNGCIDDSERIIRQYIDYSGQNLHVVESERGIVTAFRRGVESRRLDGFVGKIDADVVIHPHALDLMERCLVENHQARVTYAEPLTHDAENPFNVLSHNPEFATRRNYYTGKTSLYRTDPFAEPVMSSRSAWTFATEDVPLSFNFAYYYGLASIVRAPGACVFEKCVENYDDFCAQVWRAECEISRVLQAAPYFSKLLPAMRQDVTYEPLRELIQKALSVPRTVADWTRLESTK